MSLTDILDIKKMEGGLKIDKLIRKDSILQNIEELERRDKSIIRVYEFVHRYIYSRILMILFRPYFREYRGFENIPRAKGNIIFIANHNSLLDSFLLTPYLILRTQKIVYILGDRRVWKSNPLYGFISRITGNGILMDRDDPEDVRRGLHDCIRKLREGGVVLIFPEGTRGIPDNIAEFKRGIYMIAFRSRATIVPVYLMNVGLLSYKGKRFPSRFKALFKLSINVGSEIGYAEYSPYRKKPDEFCEYLRERVSQLRNRNIR